MQAAVKLGSAKSLPVAPCEAAVRVSVWPGRRVTPDNLRPWMAQSQYSVAAFSQIMKSSQPQYPAHDFELQIFFQVVRCVRVLDEHVAWDLPNVLCPPLSRVAKEGAHFLCVVIVTCELRMFQVLSEFMTLVVREM